MLLREKNIIGVCLHNCCMQARAAWTALNNLMKNLSFQEGFCVCARVCWLGVFCFWKKHVLPRYAGQQLLVKWCLSQVRGICSSSLPSLLHTVQEEKSSEGEAGLASNFLVGSELSQELRFVFISKYGAVVLLPSRNPDETCISIRVVTGFQSELFCFFLTCKISGSRSRELSCRLQAKEETDGLCGSRCLSWAQGVIGGRTAAWGLLLEKEGSAAFVTECFFVHVGIDMQLQGRYPRMCSLLRIYLIGFYTVLNLNAPLKIPFKHLLLLHLEHLVES